MASPNREIWIDVFDTPYSNGVNTAANAIFLGLICLSLAACVAIAWRKRRFIPFTFVLCVAYVFDIWTYGLRFQDWSLSLFSTQYGLATITPVFVTIAIHLATAQVITVLGASHSPLSPAVYLRTFIWSDIAILCVQSLGLTLTFSGAVTAGPWGITFPQRAHTGQTILFAGLLLHTLSLATALILLAATYTRRALHRKTAHPHHVYTATAAAHPLSALFLAALPLASTSVLARCAYRTVAAWGGLGSSVARNALLWLVFEGALLTEALVALAAFHPALWCLDSNTNNNNNNTQHDIEAGKRFSAATTLSMADLSPLSPERKVLRHVSSEGGEGSRLMMFGRDSVGGGHGIMAAASEAGSSDAAMPGSRRESAAVLADPYYSYVDPFATPREEDHRGEDPYEARFSEDITRGGSRAWEDDDGERFETESFVQPPRKSSKRLSRANGVVVALSSPPPPASSAAALLAEAEDRVDDDDAESFVQPPRKSSKRMSAPPARGLSVRSEEDDRLEVASIILPSRNPSKTSTAPGRGDLDAVSLYSQ